MRALICLHGLLSTRADFTAITIKLKRRYDKIVCYDLPGHGTNALKYNTKNVKKFVVDIYDSLASQYEIIDVIGYSMGGVMACYLQSVRKVHRLVLLAPSYRYLNLKNYHYTKTSSGGKNKISAVFPKKNYLHIFRFAKIMFDLSNEFSIIYPETLILWGKEDYLVKEESGILLFEKIKNKNKRLIQLERHNHFNILNSPQVLNYVNDFLV
ncbi:MAG: alpha/beta fold hydrolase [Anaeroplasmataceae bacterium]|nr:alpha/beta fold hydrolase [Anaeroplasmataceae bacterium]